MSPSREEHLAKEAHHAAFENEIQRTGRFPGWAATGTFYRALHLVDAYLADNDTHPSTHQMRNDVIRRQLPEIAIAYMALLRISVNSRYEPEGRVSASDYDRARVLFEHIEAELRPRIA